MWSLHGGGGYGSDGLLQTTGSLPDAIRRHVERCVSAKPCRWDARLAETRGKAALAELDQAIIEFSGDRSRVYLTGASAGGNGSWYRDMRMDCGAPRNNEWRML